jgi:hypothetical protein
MQSLTILKDTTPPIAYNDKVVDRSVPDGQCVLAQNVFLDNNKIKGRNGYTMIANDTAENKPNLGFCAYETASGKQLLKINDNSAGTAANLFYWTGTGNWVKVASPTFTAGVACSMVVANSKVYIANGIDANKRWDISTLVLTNLTTPVAPYLNWFHNFLFALKNSRVYISAISDPETFPVSSYVDINPDDGDNIIGSSSLKDELIISKTVRQYSFQGWTEISFSVTQVNEKLASYGAVSDDSFVNIGNDLLFMSFNGDIPHIRSLKTTEQSATIYGGVLTDPQEGTMKGLSKGQLGKVAGIFDGRKAWFFMPNGSSTYNDLTLVYDTVTNGTTKHIGIYSARGVTSTISGTRKVYFADSRNSKVYVFDTSNSDNGTAIEEIFISRRYQPDFTRREKFKYLYLQYARTSTGTMSVYTSVDDYAFDLLGTVDLKPPVTTFSFTFPFMLGATTEGDIRYELPYNVNRNIQVKYYKNDTTAPMEIFESALYLKPKALRAEIPLPSA